MNYGCSSVVEEHSYLFFYFGGWLVYALAGCLVRQEFLFAWMLRVLSMATTFFSFLRIWSPCIIRNTLILEGGANLAACHVCCFCNFVRQ